MFSKLIKPIDVFPAESEENPIIQPFKQMPSENNPAHQNIDRLTAHDLFCYYTAQIIKEDIIFAR